PPYDYWWDTGLNDSLITNMCADTFYVTVYDDSLCSRMLMVEMIEPDSIEMTFTSTPITCNGDCDGSITVAVTGGTIAVDYLYAWDDPGSQSTAMAAGLCDGTFNVTVTDDNTCTNTDSYILTEPPLLDGSITDTTHVMCYGDTTGIAIVTPSGGVPPYTYSWTNGQSDSTAINLGAGTYYVTTTDYNGCTRTDSVTITQPDSLQLSFTTTDVPCGGTCTGTATANLIGGTPGFSFGWDVSSGNQITQTAINLCAGFYSVTVTDNNTCSVSGMVEIQDTSDLTINIDNVTGITCAGLCDGTVQVSATGGYPFVPPPDYVYSWSTGDTIVDNLTGLCVGLYYVTVYDDSLCSDADTFSIDDADILAATFLVTNMSCNGVCDGELIVHPTGGTPPIVSIVWYDNTTDTIVTGLCAGYYPVTITDSNGCVVTDSAEVIEPPQIVIAFFEDTSISCFGTCDGAISVIPSGGTPPYASYVWTGGLTDSTISSLCAGDYYVTVTDANGCSETAMYTLIQPDSIEISFINIVQVACGGDSSGTVEATVTTGGTSPFTWSWSNGDDTAVADSLHPGIYYVTVTDLNGCTNSENFEVTDTSDIVLSVVDSTLIACFGQCTGTYTVAATGGYPPYDYWWDGILNDSVITNMCADTFIVTVYDDSLCSRSLEIILIDPDSLYANYTDSIEIACANDCNGSLTITPGGGTPGYTYIWDIAGQVDSTITDLCPGPHSVTVTDNNGCIVVADYANMNAPPPLLDSITTVNPLCATSTFDGEIQLYPYGGTQPYTFLWSNDSTTQDIDSIEGGMYYVTITDFVGCTQVDSTEVLPGIVVDANAEADTIICSGDTVTLYGWGETLGQFAFWTTSATQIDTVITDSLTISPDSSVTYYYFVWDSICYDVDSVIVLTFPIVGVDAGDSVIIYHEESTQLSATGGDTLTYQWYPETWLDDPTSANPIATPEETTVYYVYATTPNGCVEVDSVTIYVIPKVIIPSGFTPNGDGINDTWEIDYLHFFADVLIEVYNRWGEKLFIYTGPGAGYEYDRSKQWDGTYNGKPVPVGTYYFVIDFHMENEEKPLTGPLTILR
ncbi:MAG: gliding motility-associated C-terminal domain-containing protein, partial [Bacteroidota bacterium]